MTRIAFWGMAAVLLACAPAVAQQAPEAPDASVANEATAPSAIMATETSEEAEAPSIAGTPGDPMVCKRGKAERHVNVVAPGAEGRVCEVHYAKPTEGVENRMLWYATSDKSFCDERASTLMARLTSAGWSCTNPDGTPVSIEAVAPAETAPEVVSAPGADAPADPEEPADAPDEPADEGDEPN
jgi:hypothetical protein